AGGFDGNIVVTMFARYNPTTNAWTSLAAMPTAGDGPATVYSPINNKVYVFGGADDPGNGENITRIYDVTSGTWSTGAVMPDAGTRFAGKGYYNGKIYLVGGSTSVYFNDAQAQTWEYDPVANTWNTSRASLPTALLVGGSGVVSGHLFILGGADSTSAVVSTT